MADPHKFTPGYDYTSWQASNPTKPLPANRVDQDMANIATSIEEAIEAIKNVRRSDGALKNGIVTIDSLSPQVAAGVGAGALASAEAAATSADAASDSAAAAAASATAADGSATAASGYASTALTYRNAADGFADDSAAAATLSQTARDFAAAWATAGSGVDVNDGVNPVGKSAYHWAQVAEAAAAGSVADGSITTAKLADGALSADVTGRAKMADGFVTSAKIADGTIATGDLADGALSADVTGRAKMADGFVTSAKIANGTIGAIDISSDLAFGQCLMTLSGGNILVSRRGGKLLTINGQHELIPSAGVSLAPTGFTATSNYLIAAYMNSGTMTLERLDMATYTYAMDTTTGMPVKKTISGGALDATRTIVGMVGAVAGPAFADTAAQRLVISYFNRRSIGAQKNFASDRSTPGTSYVEVDTEIRLEFLTWDDEAVELAISATVANTTNGRGTITSVAIDGTTAEAAEIYAVSSTGGYDVGASLTLHKSGLSAGRHYATLLGKTDGSGTSRWRGASATYGKTVLSVQIRG